MALMNLKAEPQKRTDYSPLGSSCSSISRNGSYFLKQIPLGYMMVFYSCSLGQYILIQLVLSCTSLRKHRFSNKNPIPRMGYLTASKGLPEIASQIQAIAIVFVNKNLMFKLYCWIQYTLWLQVMEKKRKQISTDQEAISLLTGFQTT